MQIGGNTYLVEIKLFPYLQGLVNFQKYSGQLRAGQIAVHHVEIPFFDIINYVVSHQAGYRTFELMPDRGFNYQGALNDYRTLFKTFELLCIHVTGDRTLADIDVIIRRQIEAWSFNAYIDWKAVKDAYEMAGDAALMLMWLLLNGELEAEYDEELANPAFQMVDKIVSHPRLWAEKTKWMVLQAYQDRYGQSLALMTNYSTVNEELREYPLDIHW